MKAFLASVKWTVFAVGAAIWSLFVVLAIYMVGALIGALGFGLLAGLVDMFLGLFQFHPAMNILVLIAEAAVTVVLFGAYHPKPYRIINTLLFMVVIYVAWTHYVHAFLINHGLTR